MRRLHTWTLLFLLLPACKSGGGGSGGETEGTGSTGGTGSGTATAGSSGGSSSGTTGGTGGALMPCDPLAPDCGADLCAGRPSAGYYCRPPCPAGASEGDACDGGVCLPMGAPDGVVDELACYELDACDFITGDGCEAGETCAVVDASPVRTACVPSGGSTAGEPCAPNGVLACGPGLACLGSDLDGPDPGVCGPWCVPGDPLPADCQGCIAINPDIGTCAECNILDDTCGAGTQCQPVNEFGGGLCIPFGSGGEDDPCEPVDPNATCQEGLLCLEVEQDMWSCVPTCDPKAPGCSDPDKTCNDIGLLQPDLQTGKVGVCSDLEQMFCVPGPMPVGCAQDQVCYDVGNVGLCGDACDPLQGDMSCMGNYGCLPVDDEGKTFLAPFLAGNGVCGSGCAGDMDCTPGGTCLLLADFSSAGLCGVTCTPANPTECMAGETCVPLGADPLVGACVPGGSSCDPALPTSCGAGLHCAAIAGGAMEGTCVEACFAQQANTCSLPGDACIGRTDAPFHAGVCLGQKTPCDVLAQTGCDADQTCSVLGGGPIGGAAFVCEAAGAIPEGGDCALDASACAPGLACHEDVCRPYCDPGGAPCPQGTCTDISADVGLAAGTVGVCM